MIGLVIGCFILGVFLSAFFSGCETGFYRVTRLRLVMDGMRGDQVAKRLLWLTNNPSLFVATALIGNNIANYLTSLAIVMGSQLLMGEPSLAVDIVAPIAMAPILFIYGESLPKNLFLKMPNYLLRKSGLIFLLFFGLLLPVSSLLWLIGRALEKLVGQSPVQARLALARKEIDEILQEGQDAGILQKGQRDLANSMFVLVNRPISEFVRPLSRVMIKTRNPDSEQLEEFARKQKIGFVVYRNSGNALVAVRVAQLLVGGKDAEPIPLVDFRSSEIHGSILVKMQTERIPIAKVVDPQGKDIGVVLINDLTSTLLEK